MTLVNMVFTALAGMILMSGCGKGVVTEQSDDKIEPHKIKKVYMDDFRNETSFQYHVTADDHTIDFEIEGTAVASHTQFYIDVDNSGETGYNDASLNDTGAEYLLEDWILFKYVGTGGLDWNWEVVSDDIRPYEYTQKRSLNLKSFIPELGNSFSTEASVLDENWEMIDYTVNKKYIFLFNKIKDFNIEENQELKVVLHEYEDSLHFETLLHNQIDFDGHIQYYLDIDNSNETGYTTELISGGFEYLLEDDRVYKYNGGNANSWEWELVDFGHLAFNDGKIESRFLKSSIDFIQEEIQVGAILLDNEWNQHYYYNPVDIKLAKKISFIGSVDIEYAHSVRISADEKTAFIIDMRNVMHIVDITDLSNPSVVSKISGHNSPEFLISNDNTKVYTVNHGYGDREGEEYDDIRVYDISDTSNPTVTGSLRTGYLNHNPALSPDGNRIYASQDDKIIIINISDATNPSIEGYIESYAYIYSSFVFSKDSSKIYFANNDGIQIFDVSNAANPLKLSSIQTDGRTDEITISEDNSKIFASNNENGLKIIDVSDVANPILTGSVDSRWIKQLKESTDGTKLYFESFNHFKVVDISDVTNPSIVSSIEFDDYIERITLSSNNSKAFIAIGDKGLKIIDISDASNLSILSSVDTIDNRDVALSSNNTIIYITDSTINGGLKIYSYK